MAEAALIVNRESISATDGEDSFKSSNKKNASKSKKKNEMDLLENKLNTRMDDRFSSLDEKLDKMMFLFGEA